MPGVVEEPGKCDICLSLQAGSLQSLTHQALTEALSGASPSTPLCLHGLLIGWRLPERHWCVFF